jgi:hypothetical protein
VRLVKHLLRCQAGNPSGTTQPQAPPRTCLQIPVLLVALGGGTRWRRPVADPRPDRTVGPQTSFNHPGLNAIQRDTHARRAPTGPADRHSGAREARAASHPGDDRRIEPPGLNAMQRETDAQQTPASLADRHSAVSEARAASHPGDDHRIEPPGLNAMQRERACPSAEPGLEPPRVPTPTACPRHRCQPPTQHEVPNAPLTGPRRRPPKSPQPTQRHAP